MTRALGKRLGNLRKEKNFGTIIITTLCLHAIEEDALWMVWASGSLPDVQDPLRDGNCWIWRQNSTPGSFGRVKETDLRNRKLRRIRAGNWN